MHFSEEIMVYSRSYAMYAFFCFFSHRYRSAKWRCLSS